MKPTAVQVNATECPVFERDDLYSYETFEAMASHIAANIQPMSGTQNLTTVTVTFDNGVRLKCTLKLMEGGDYSFEDHIGNVLALESRYEIEGEDVPNDVFENTEVDYLQEIEWRVH
jgi:hypothetical protein